MDIVLLFEVVLFIHTICFLRYKRERIDSISNRSQDSMIHENQCSIHHI